MVDVLRQYSLPLFLAISLHTLAVAALYQGFSPDKQLSNVIKPEIVKSHLLVLEPKAKAKPKPPPPKPQPQVEQPKPERKAPPQPEVKKPEEPEVDLEAERRKAEEAARRERLQALSQSAFDDLLQQESTEIAAGDAEAVAQSYRYGIYERVVANWSRPPSARKGMQVRLLVELVPTGDVVAVTITESSGNAAFDRSAEAAVRRARKFEVPSENDIFERHFRRFALLFKPEDLLR